MQAIVSEKELEAWRSGGEEWRGGEREERESECGEREREREAERDKRR